MKNLFAAVILASLGLSAAAQDDLLNILNEDEKQETNYTTATFKSTRTKRCFP
jgi:hypothetical protein